MRVLIIIFLCTGLCRAMQPQQPPQDDKRSNESSPSRFAFLSQIVHRTSSPTAGLRAAASSSPSSSGVSTPSISSSPSALRDDQTVVKSPRLADSPTGSRLAKTVGRRDSKELSGHLKEQLALLEKSEITVSQEELKARLEAAQKEQNADKKKRELEQLSCAKIKGETTFEITILKQRAADAVFEMNAHQIAVMLQNRLTYMDQKNVQEAKNQVLPIMKLYCQQHDLLLHIYETEQNVVHEYHENRWRTWRKMAPIFRNIEEHLQKDPKEGKLQEYQASIKEEQFVPK